MDEARPDPDAEAAATDSVSGTDPEASMEPSGGAAAPEPPALLRWAPDGGPADPPQIDAYSLRMVAARRLYDNGTLVQRSPSLARLGAPTPLRVNPGDLERLGVTSGGRVRVTSSRTSLVLDVVADAGVPRGSALLAFNQPGEGAADLIDASAPVTDIRVETTE